MTLSKAIDVLKICHHIISSPLHFTQDVQLSNSQHGRVSFTTRSSRFPQGSLLYWFPCLVCPAGDKDYDLDGNLSEFTSTKERGQQDQVFTKFSQIQGSIQDIQRWVQERNIVFDTERDSTISGTYHASTFACDQIVRCISDDRLYIDADRNTADSKNATTNVRTDADRRTSEEDTRSTRWK